MPYAAETINISMAPYVLVLMAILLTCVAIIFMATLMDSDADTVLVRAWQHARLSGTRMRRMLKVRGIDVGEYVRRYTVPELREQVDACQECLQHELCDRALESSRLGGETALSFCPNRPAVERYLAASAAPGRDRGVPLSGL